MTAWNRLADILPIFDSDRRVQLTFTFPDVSKVTGYVDQHLRDSGAIVLSWATALVTEFDLAISVHHSGDLHRLRAPLAVLSHGIGYTKRLESRIENRESRIENRESRIENRESRIENVYGLSREWLIRSGRVPDAVVLPHESDRPRLARSVPEALPNVLVAGDPCFDRMRSSLDLRAAYRQALGATPGTMVVTVSSTWGPGSLLARHPDLISNLLAELSIDDHLVCAVFHPNAWFAHGPLQMRMWMADALRAGLRLVPPERGWQQAILAADVVIGDHGAVTGYAAAQGIPTLLAAFPRNEVASGSVIDMLGDLAPALHTQRPLPEQLAQAVADHDPARLNGVTELATSRPDKCHDILRSAFYRMMKLSEPDDPAPVFPYPAADLTPHREPTHSCWVYCETDPEVGKVSAVRVNRWPADVTSRRTRGPRAVDALLAARYDHPRRDLRSNADIVVVPRPGPGSTETDLDRAIRQRPACTVVAAEIGTGTVALRYRNGTRLTARLPDPCPQPLPPALVAAAALDRWPESRGYSSETVEFVLHAGSQRITVLLSGIGAGIR